MSALTSWWSRQRWAPPRASYEYPCTHADPTDTLDRYASNEYRNSVSSVYLPLALGAVAAVGWKVTDWEGFRLLGVVVMSGAAVWCLLTVALLVAYFVRVRKLARRYWEAGAAEMDVAARRRLATDLITADLARRRFAIRPTVRSAHEGESDLIPVGAVVGRPYSARVWRTPGTRP